MFDPYYLDMLLRVLAICLVLTGIHGYLGIHVLARQVIFVDLAMAQIAALGATYALLLGFDPSRHPEDAFPAYLFSLGLTLLGAAVFALTRARHERVPQEAVIGIVYASASAIVILMLAKSPTAGEQIKHMLVGNILLIGWPTILKTSVIYAVIGFFHWLCRGTFLKITTDPAAAERDGTRVRLWDFLFYGTFGVVITSSVAIGGVLLVFSFLVVPAAIGMLFSESTRVRVGVAWAAGTTVSVIGILFSFWADLPAGPAVVASFAVVLVAAALCRFIQEARSRIVAALKVGTAMALVAGLVYGTTLLRKRPESHEHPSEFAALAEALASDDVTRQLDAIHHVEEDPDPHFAPHVVRLLERTRSDQVIEHAAQVLPLFQDPAAVAVLKRLGQRDLDPFLRVEIAEGILRCRSPDGIPILLDVLEHERAPVVRAAALDVLSRLTGKTFGYEADASLAENAAALTQWHAYWSEHGSHLRWRERLHRFE
jgi:zinc/manganese transport system permease protein